jgi:hypothetical protein
MFSLPQARAQTPEVGAVVDLRTALHHLRQGQQFYGRIAAQRGFHPCRNSSTQWHRRQ